MTLGANAALPAGYRKRPAVDADALSKAKHAAAIVFVAPDGEVLVCRRSLDEKNYGGHWSLPGGGAEDGETPEQAARREAGEELGGEATMPLKLLDQRITPTGMAFTTFAAPVEKKFQPRLNDEHLGYAWAPIDALPRPLHPGVESTLSERLGLTADMEPEQWAGLRDGFLQWLQEEQREPEHANDEMIQVDVDDEEGQLAKLLAYIKENSEVGHSFEVVVDPSDPELARKFYIDGDGAFRIRDIKLALDRRDPRLALDRESVRSIDPKNGHLRVSLANITKANVCPYRGDEIPGWQELGLDPDRVYQLLRDPEEIAKAMPTSNGVPILRQHKPVYASDHSHEDVIGSVGTEAKWSAPYGQNSLIFWDGDAIKDIDGGKKRELSAGYHYRPDMTPGNFGGTSFDGVMRDIHFNHVALVEDGRAGPDVVVGDSTENLTMKPTRLAAATLFLTGAHVSPILALDQKLTLPDSLFKDITSKNFGAKKKDIVAAVSKGLAADGMLRKGMAFDEGGLVRLLDALEGTSKGADESASEEQHKAMQAAAAGESNLGIPASVGKEFVDADKDAFDAEPLLAKLREKGMGEDDINEISGMLPKKNALDEEPDEDDENGKKKPPFGKDNKMISKTAMDEAIKTAKKEVRDTERAIRAAFEEVRPWVGQLNPTLACDSAADVHRHALKALGMRDVDKLHADALMPILRAQPKPGAKPKVNDEQRLGMDEDQRGRLSKMVPGLDRIQFV